MTTLQQKIETVFAGLIYVAIGTALAVTVDAQSSKKSCDSKAPGAVCGIGEEAPASDMKICFGAKHSRCYEMNGLKFSESVNGNVGRETTVTKSEADQVTKAVTEYRSWLEAKKASPNTSVCRNAIIMNVGSAKKEFCTGNLARKEMQDRNKELFKVLDNAGVKSSH